MRVAKRDGRYNAPTVDSVTTDRTQAILRTVVQDRQGPLSPAV